MDKRILELALETLQKKKAEIDTEIIAIERELGGSRSIKSAKKQVRKKPRFSAAERKRRSERMKANWAAKRKEKAAAEAKKKAAAEKRKATIAAKKNKKS